MWWSKYCYNHIVIFRQYTGILFKFFHVPELPLAFYLNFSMYQGYLIFLNAAHVITRLLLDEIYPPLGINIWLNAICT